MKNYILLAIFSVLYWQASAQIPEPVYRQLTEKDGLPSNTVYSIIQDKQGYIWLGTPVGLFRYDGVRYREYSGKQLKNKEVFDLSLQPDGKLWYHNLAGQVCYLENEKVQVFAAKGWRDSLQIGGMTQSPDANLLYIGLRDSTVRVFDLQKRELVKVITSQHNAVYNGMITHPSDQLLISFGLNQNVVYHPRFNSLTPIDLPAKFEGRLNLMRLPDNSLFVYDTKATHAVRLIWGENRFIMHSYTYNLPADLRTYKFVSDRVGQVWLTSARGIYRLSKDYSRIENAYLSANDILNFMQDKDGNYWVALRNEGIYVIPSFDFLSAKIGDRSVERAVPALCLTRDSSIYAGYGNGMVRCFDMNNQIKTYTTGLISSVGSLTERLNGEIWGVGNDGIWLRMPSGKAITLKLQSSYKRIAEDENGQLWVGTSTRLQTLTPPHDAKGYTTSLDGIKFESVLNSRITELFYDKPNHRLVVGTPAGLFFVRNKAVTQFLPDGKGFNYSVMSLTSMPDGTLCVGTSADGLFMVRGNSISAQFNNKNGLSSNNCQELYCDKTGTLWVGTDKGLNIFNPIDQTFSLVDKCDGLLTNIVYSLVRRGEDVWVGSPDGTTAFKASASHLNLVPPDIYLTNVAVWERDTTLMPKYDLSYHQNNIRLEFVGLAYRSAGSFKYKYRLLGLDSSWTFVPASNNIVRYPLLDPGDYTFQVCAINEDGIESTQRAEVKIVIHRAFWQTWWFWTIIIASIAFIVWWVFSNRIQYLKNQNQTKQELRRSQLTALKTQMNPHFIFNALNSIQHYIAFNDAQNANRYLSKFSNLIRATLNMSDQDEITLAQEIDALRLYLELEAMRFEDDFTYKLQIDPSLTPETVRIPSMLIQPYIENAIKHGLLHRAGGRLLNITFKHQVSDDILICEVEDNGIGRARSAELKKQKNSIVAHNSRGMSLTEQRLNLLNAARRHKLGVSIEDLYDENNVALGTKVRIVIPIL